MSANKDAKFYISQEDWNKVIGYAESAYHQFKSEIGGQLVLIEDEDGDFILKEPVILKQEVSGGNCEMEEEALAIHYSKMVGKYGPKVRHCWWHSHHTMGAFWSGTDDATILKNKVQDFSVSLVVNLKQEYKLRVQFFYPIEHYEDVEINILSEDSKERNTSLDKEVEELCSRPKTIPGNYIRFNKENKGLNQTNLWTNADQAEVNAYNHGYGILDSDLDTSLVPEDKMKPIHDLIENTQDKIVDGNCKYEEFLQIRKEINKSIEKYNLKIREITKFEFQHSVFHYYPDDFLENINGGINLAN